MLVWAARTAPRALARGFILLGIFIAAVIMQTGFTSGLRAVGVAAGQALFFSGLGVLALVLLVNWQVRAWARRRAAAFETARERQGLPEGACCVIWRGAREASGAIDMPWELVDAIRIAYPRAARRFGIEGAAVIEFEIGADGAAKNLSCADVWPADVFYRAAADGLAQARFRLKWGAEARFGASYRMPFIFQIAGAGSPKDAGNRAARKRPILEAAAGAAQRFRRRA